MFRIAALKAAIKLEIAGMTKRGESAYSIAKREFGLKGTRKQVAEKLQKMFEERVNETRHSD